MVFTWHMFNEISNILVGFCYFFPFLDELKMFSLIRID